MCTRSGWRRPASPRADAQGRPGVAGDDPTLTVLASVYESIRDPGAKRRARARAKSVLETLPDELNDSDWYSDGWLDEVLAKSGLILIEPVAAGETSTAAQAQARAQRKIILDATRSSEDKRQAERLRAEAEFSSPPDRNQSLEQSDFYSYRYFASEGFLPGYNFPRLPLSAYIPGDVPKTGMNIFRVLVSWRSPNSVRGPWSITKAHAT